MGYRLSKIYTRTGDNGTTGLSDGSRVNKDDPRVAAMGTVDELNNFIGVILAEAIPERTANMLQEIQHTLFDLGGELSLPGKTLVSAEQVTELETWLDELNTELNPLKEFVLPGGTPAAAWCHVARGVCRRAERCVVSLARQSTVSPQLQTYLNRLSDLLFVLARWLNRSAGQPDQLWRQDR